MMTMIIVRDIWFQTKPDLFCADQNQNGERGPPGPWEIPLACLLPSDALIKMGSWVKMASGPLTRGPWEILPAGWCWLDSIVSPSNLPLSILLSWIYLNPGCTRAHINGGKCLVRSKFFSPIVHSLPLCQWAQLGGSQFSHQLSKCPPRLDSCTHLMINTESLLAL